MASSSVSAHYPLPAVGSSTPVAAPAAAAVAAPAPAASVALPPTVVGVPVSTAGGVIAGGPGQGAPVLTQAALSQAIAAAGPQGGYADLLKPSSSTIMGGGPSTAASQVGLGGAPAAGGAVPTGATSGALGGATSVEKRRKVGKSKAAMAAPGGTGGTRDKILALARTELKKGVKETSTNDSKDIRRYRSATAGALNTPGAWCAYFVSYIMKQAGVPVMGGKGTGRVAEVLKWAKQNGRAKSGKSTPKPGDMILIRGTSHIGIVSKVVGNKIHTIEGNASNRVRTHVYTKGSSAIYAYVSPEN